MHSPSVFSPVFYPFLHALVLSALLHSTFVYAASLLLFLVFVVVSPFFFIFLFNLFWCVFFLIMFSMFVICHFALNFACILKRFSANISEIWRVCNRCNLFSRVTPTNVCTACARPHPLSANRLADTCVETAQLWSLTILTRTPIVKSSFTHSGKQFHNWHYVTKRPF